MRVIAATLAAVAIIVGSSLMLGDLTSRLQTETATLHLSPILTPKEIFIELMATRLRQSFVLYFASHRHKKLPDLLAEFITIRHSIVFDAYRLHARGYRITSLLQDGQIMGLSWYALHAYIAKTDAKCDYLLSPIADGPGESFQISAIARGLGNPGYEHTVLFAGAQPCRQLSRQSSVCVYLVQTCDS